MHASDWLYQLPPNILEGAIFTAASADAPALAARSAVTAAQHNVLISAPSAAAALRTCLHSAALDEYATHSHDNMWLFHHPICPLVTSQSEHGAAVTFLLVVPVYRLFFST